MSEIDAVKERRAKAELVKRLIASADELLVHCQEQARIFDESENRELVAHQREKWRHVEAGVHLMRKEIERHESR